MASHPTRPRIYLAGFDVFRPDATTYFQGLVRAAAAAGLEALPPSEGTGYDGPTHAGQGLAQHLYADNMQRLRSADGVIANLAPFRGIEPDSGTVFEVGVAVALGLPVVAYGVPPGSYASRVQSTLATQRDNDGVIRDADGMAVEEFELPLNIMLACSVSIAPSAHAALEVLAHALLRKSDFLH